MVSRKRDIGREILKGIREIKRGDHGRVTTLPPAAAIRQKKDQPRGSVKPTAT